MRLAYMVCTPDVPSRTPSRGLRGELSSCFRALAEIGYQGVELSVSDPDEAFRHVDEIAAQADSFGLTICAINTDEMALRHHISLGALDDDEFTRAEMMMCRAAELAARFRCCVSVGRVRGTSPPKMEPPMVLSRAVGKVFHEIAQTAKENGCQVALEAIAPPASNWITDTRTALSVAVRINRPSVRILLDSATVYQVDPPIEEVLEGAAPFVRHVRLREDTNGVPGEGSVDHASFVHSLKKHGYDRWATVDVTADDGVEAARRSYEAVAGLVGADAP